VAEVLATEAGLSLRDVAARVGVSPETVRSVRRQMERTAIGAGDSGAINRNSPNRPATASEENPYLYDGGRQAWSHDSACSATEEGRAFAAWFDAHSLHTTDLSTYSNSVPVSRLYEVVDDARRRATFWHQYATTLEQQCVRVSG
jgi:hypothetical protein